jgi:glucose-6-phosphate 1-dehydrogenase
LPASIKGLTAAARAILPPRGFTDYIESVQITMAESFGVEGRGSFYEESGAIRDVIQNHMLQLVGFLAMESPPTTSRDSIRDEQAKVFRMIRPLSPEDLVRGQFRGYRQEAGVARDSKVEHSPPAGSASTHRAGTACPSSSARASAYQRL